MKSKPLSLTSLATALLVAVIAGGFWADNVRPLAAVLALAAVVVLAWQTLRARARRRFLAALDAHAEREIRQDELFPRTADDLASAG